MSFIFISIFYELFFYFYTILMLIKRILKIQLYVLLKANIFTSKLGSEIKWVVLTRLGSTCSPSLPTIEIYIENL